MTETSATWVDVKLKLEGQVVLHLELRGYRGDGDMSVQLWHICDAIHSLLQDTVFAPAFVVTIFQGWGVVATSWEVGGRLHACSEGGVVVALDFPLCHVEVRFVRGPPRIPVPERGRSARCGGEHRAGSAYVAGLLEDLGPYADQKCPLVQRPRSSS